MQTGGPLRDVVVPEPNTWKEIVEAVAERTERRIAVQEYGRPNLEMNRALENLGAQVTPMAIYRWELAGLSNRFDEAARRLAPGQFDVVLFTSSIQLDHLLQIASEVGLESEVAAALREFTAVASVGPVMTASLKASGFPADLEPVHPKMAALVKVAADDTHAVLAKKRQAHKTP